MKSFCYVILFNFYILIIISLICIIILLTSDYDKETVRNYCGYIFAGFVILSLVRYSFMKDKKPEFTFCEFIGGNNEISGGYWGESWVNAVANVISGTPSVDENTKQRPRISALPTTDSRNYGVNRTSILNYRANDEVNPIKDENVVNAMKDLKVEQPLVDIKDENDENEKNEGIVQKIINWWYGKKKLKKIINSSKFNELMENDRNANTIIANDEDDDAAAINFLQGMIVNKTPSKTQSKTQSNDMKFNNDMEKIRNRPI